MLFLNLNRDSRCRHDKQVDLALKNVAEDFSLKVERFKVRSLAHRVAAPRLRRTSDPAG